MDATEVDSALCQRLDAIIGIVEEKIKRYPAVVRLEHHQQRFHALPPSTPKTLASNAEVLANVAGTIHDYHVRKGYETKQAEYAELHDRLKDLRFALTSLQDRPEATQTVGDCFTAAEDAAKAIK